MFACNVIACSNCSFNSIKPANCPIQLKLNQPTHVVGIETIDDEDMHASIGVSCFQSNKYDEVRFIHCSCLSGTVVSHEYSLKRFNKFEPEVSHETLASRLKRQGTKDLRRGLGKFDQTGEFAFA